MSMEPTQDRFTVRKLALTDNSKGFIALLQQLTTCPPLSDSQFASQFHDLASHGDDHLICVIEDTHSHKIVATGSVFLEKKFLRNCGKVGHVEDVVVDASARGLKLGQRVIEFLTSHAKSMGCYKGVGISGTEQSGSLRCTEHVGFHFKKDPFIKMNEMHGYFRIKSLLIGKLKYIWKLSRSLQVLH